MIGREKEFFQEPLKELSLHLKPTRDQKVDNLKLLYFQIQTFYSANFEIKLESELDFQAMVDQEKCYQSLVYLVELIFGIVLKSDESQDYIEKILELDENTQQDLQGVVQRSIQMIDGNDNDYGEDDEQEDLPQPEQYQLNTMENKSLSLNAEGLMYA